MVVSFANDDFTKIISKLPDPQSARNDNILKDFFIHKLNLNEASRDQLKHLQLTDTQIENILNHRKEYGKLISIYELQVIPGLDINTIKGIQPFVYVDEVWPTDNVDIFTATSKKKLKRKRYYNLLVRYSTTFETTNGYKDGIYLGTPDNMLTRIIYTHPNGYKAAIAWKKKTYESLGPHHYSFYISLKNKWFVQQALIGTYKLGCGQSLIFNNCYVFKKTLKGDNLCRNNLRLKPMHSCSDDEFMGPAIDLKFSNLNVVLFYAHNQLDATVKDDVVSKIYRYNRYITDNDLTKRHQVDEQVIGTIVEYNINNYSKVGVSCALTFFDKEIRSKLPYEFSGKRNTALGIYGQSNIAGRVNVFGECAYADGLGVITGGNTTFKKFFTTSILARYYDPEFHSLYGNAFREQSNFNSNEYGLCHIYDVQINKNILLSLAVDHFVIPQPTLQIKNSQSGIELLTTTTYTFNRQHKLSGSFKYKRKSEDNNDISKNSYTWGLKARNCLHKWEFNTQYTLKNNNSSSNNVGHGISENVIHKYGERVKDGFSFSFINTSKDNVIYVKERPLYREGNNGMLCTFPMIKLGYMISYKFDIGLRLEGKYSFTYAYDDDHLGSNHNRIEGPFKNELKLQLTF